MKPEALQALGELHTRMYESSGVNNPEVRQAMSNVFDNLEPGESLDIQFATEENRGAYSIRVGQSQTAGKL